MARVVAAILLGALASACLPSAERPVFFADEVGNASTEYDRAAFDGFRKGTALSGEIAFEDDTRISLLPPLPSRLSFDVRIPDRAALRFSVGVKVLEETDVWPAVEFRLLLRQGGREEILFAEEVDRYRPNRWLDHELDLSRWAGKNARVTFETRLRRGTARVPWTARRILPIWGNPFLANGAPGGRSAPTLLLISIDCLRADHVGAYGYHRDTTPQLDRLAADGTLFENSVSTSSWTLPSHLSMLTGLYPSLHGGTKWRKLDRSVPYLPELLLQKSYLTSGIASWVYLSPIYGFERGFREYRVLSDLATRGEAVVDEAIAQLRKGRAVPQFLFVHLFDPHWPYLPPEELLERFGSRPNDLSDLQDRAISGEPPRSEAERQDIVRLYDAEIAYSDRELGRLLRELEASGRYDESLIVVTADHGEAFFEHGHWQHSVSLYEEIIRVPLIVKWPRSRNAPGRGRVRSPVSQVDIFATVAAAAGIPGPFGEARDLATYREDRAASPRELVISEVSFRPPSGDVLKIALRSEKEKYVATLEVAAEGELSASRILQEELYDLTMDPAERTNLAAAGADLERFRSSLREYLRKVQAARGGTDGAPVELDERTRERLRKLGYTDF